MANQTPDASHDLTSDGITRLIAKMYEELAQVQASSASLTTKQIIASKVRTAILGLESTIAQISAGIPSSDWFGRMGPIFRDTSASIKSVINATTGACVYTNPQGCINTTSEECSALGGTFYANLACDSLPSSLTS
jgi:hypothetical protein